MAAVRRAPRVSGSRPGQPLDTAVADEMGRRAGFDFSTVRIHTDQLAVRANQVLGARAFTRGADIYFNDREYRPHDTGGRRLLGHELTHVVQQAQMPQTGARDGVIQRTTIGQVLDEFFSPFSSENLWVMPQNDNYTGIVRAWQPVRDAVAGAKADLQANCTTWEADHRTDPSWTPGRTDPPVADPNARLTWVGSPPGTDPATCRNAFIVYVSTKALPVVPAAQTFQLYTCSIGSFGIFATVDTIDCAAGTATMNIWMYNAMDRGSFGRFADHPLFALSGMERQYMWWNWSETHSWGPGGPRAPTGGGGEWGGSGDW